MKHVANCILLIGLLQAMPAAAQLCVGAAYDKPLPGAVDVVMRYADVPSAQFPGIWQEGRIDGNFYQIFSNRTAVLQPDRLLPDWSIAVNCQQRPCSTIVSGTPPEAAKATANGLVQCLLPPEVKVAAAPAKPKPDKAKPKDKEPAKDKPKVEPPQDPALPADKGPLTPDVKEAATPKPNTAPKQDAPVSPKTGATLGEARGGTGGNGGAVADGAEASPATQGTPMDAGSGSGSGDSSGNSTAKATVLVTEVVCVQEPQTKIVPLNCGLSLVPAGTSEATLQRLLVLAGADPGPVDGTYGRKTQSAVLEVLGYAGRDLTLQQSIAAVDAYLCQRGQAQP